MVRGDRGGRTDMPTTRTRRTRVVTERRVTPGERDYFFTGNYDDPDVFLGIAGSETEARELWEKVRDELLAEWIADYPGRRPWAFWKLDAKEQRRRTGGRGEVYPGYDHPCNLLAGIPYRFMRQLDVDIFRSVNPKEERKYEIYDPADPPRYESEPAYLDRLGLLTDAERKRLTEDDFADEVIAEVDDDDE